MALAAAPENMNNNGRISTIDTSKIEISSNSRSARTPPERRYCLNSRAHYLRSETDLGRNFGRRFSTRHPSARKLATAAEVHHDADSIEFSRMIMHGMGGGSTLFHARPTTSVIARPGDESTRL